MSAQSGDESTTESAKEGGAAPKTQAKEAALKKQQDDPTTQRLNAIEEKLESLVEKVDTLVKPDAGKEAGQTPEAEKQEKEEEKADQNTSKDKAPARPAAMKLDAAWLEDLPWRSIGPANMGGRIVDLAVHGKDPSLWWIATASGGLLKTKNEGVTVEHLFDREATVSIGCVAADPTNKDVIWVGTGEANPRNSVSYGDGVYKSTDDGKTWKNMGLKKTFQIGRILIDPRKPDTVYVGALGRLYGANRERGVFKTTDGGQSWEHALHVDDNTGVIDMIMHPKDPQTIIAAMWDRMRDGFDSWPGKEEKPDGIDGYDPIRKWGDDAGLYKTTDGGKNWKKLSQGLPTSNIGRVGLDWQSKSPHVIYAIIDCEDIGKGPKPFDAYLGAVGADVKGKAVITQVLPDSPAEKANMRVGDVVIRVGDEEIAKFDDVLEVLREKKPGERISLALLRNKKKFEIAPKLTVRPGAQQGPTTWMGVEIADREGKVVVSRVVEGGPAAKAGLKSGDVIAKVNNKKPEEQAKLIAQVRELAAGDKLQLNVQRGEEALSLTLTLASRPGPSPRSNAYMGIQGENAKSGGATLTRITDDGPSEKAGLKAGDVVKKINDKKVADYAALVSEIRARQPDDKMKVTLARGEEELTIEVTLGDRRGPTAQKRPYTYSYFGQRPNSQDQQGADGHLYGGVYKSTDAGETWQRVNSLNTRPMYFSVIRVDPSDEQRVYVMGVSQFRSKNGGVTFTSDFGRGVHADGHDLWIDPRDGRHMVTGGDGGFYVTYDYGDNWDHINTAAVGQFYHAAISPKRPYWVVGGLQDNGSWSGPAISRTGGAINEDWLSIGGGDGFVCRVDPTDPDLVYYESQGGTMARRHLKTGERASIRPARAEGVTYRFNWNTPFILSNHNSKIFYCGGNYVFRSVDRGDNLKKISPEITRTQRGSATAISESPRDPDVLYVGTDDGALWVTRDGGTEWTNISENLQTPGPRWVATIEASRFADGRVYVCLDGHRSNDDEPYVFVSEDFGEKFAPLHEDLPWGSTRCLREDPLSENLIYLGTEFAFWMSIDRGQNWMQCNQKLPSVAVHEVAMHSDCSEIVLATHGRSLWACDVTALRQLKPEALSRDFVLYEPGDVTRWRSEPRRGRTNRRYVAQNPQRGALLWYSLPKDAEQVQLRIENIEGQVVNQLSGKTDAGLHLVNWNMTQGRTQQLPSSDSRSSSGSSRTEKQPTESGKAEDKTAEKEESENKPAEEPSGAEKKTGEGAPPASKPKAPPKPRTTAPPGYRGTGAGRPVPNGTYRVTLVIDGSDVQWRTITLQQDPLLPPDAVAEEVYEEMLLKDETARKAKSHAKASGIDVWYDD